MKAIRLDVLRSSKYDDCSNNGVSARYNSLLIVSEEGWIDIDENNLPENLVKLVVRNIGGREYRHLEPVKPVDSDKVGYMSGGNFAYSCDSRFRRFSDYPLSIHDRQETQEMYDRMCN